MLTHNVSTFWGGGVNFACLLSPTIMQGEVAHSELLEKKRVKRCTLAPRAVCRNGHSFSILFCFCSPAKTPSSAPQVDIMAKFRRPAGSWDCDVCMVQNTAEHTKCLACESPRPGTQSIGEKLVSPMATSMVCAWC